VEAEAPGRQIANNGDAKEPEKAKTGKGAKNN
jgi:hypothetical protein